MGFVSYPQVPKRRRVFAIAFITITALAVGVFMLFDRYSISGASYNALCTVMWAHCDPNYSPPGKAMSILLAFTTWSVLAVLMQSAVEGLSKIGVQNMKRRIAGMKDHIIVAGYGNVGRWLCDTLAQKDQEFVIVEKDTSLAAKFEDLGYPYIIGDALDSETLKSAGIMKARMLVSAVGTDSNNVFLALTAKDLNPAVRVATRAYTEEAVSKLHRAGVELIVLPEMMAGIELGRELLGMPPSGKPMFSRRNEYAAPAKKKS
ncbi:MAG TPA: NAD(P)-binding protein [Candidatus Norongarragalinales archaeon]|jgi:voltage-gated potassium channel|nr:NAD(P)-binding protein [Candidatus Norongarragalinales archaeon]